MNEKDQKRVKTYLETLQTEVQFVGYTQVPINWGNKDALSPYNCLYYIEQGEGYFTIQGKSFQASAGDWVIIPAKSLHTVSTSSTAPYRKYWCHFTAKVGGAASLSAA